MRTVFTSFLSLSMFCFCAAAEAAIYAGADVATKNGPAEHEVERIKSQEISEEDGLPVLPKHLPEWETVRENAVFARSAEELKSALGEREILGLIDFSLGTEAVTARYAAGSLLIIEYSTPQASVQADEQFRSYLSANPGEPPVIYRRVGNYSVFVFDAPSEEAANALIAQVKYEKSVQWLGSDPFYYEKFEHYVAGLTRDVAIATAFGILVGIAVALILGVAAGLLFFRYRTRTRSQTAFSDAGGMIRLNLDELSESVSRQ